MAFSSFDRSEEIDKCCKEFTVKSTDFCHRFVKHPYTFLQRKECWTCRYSNFGIESGNPREIGICQYHNLKNNAKRVGKHE